MIDRILINKDIANPGIYRAKLYDDDKVYIPGIMSVKNVDSIEDKSFLPTAVWCAPCEIMTKHETPCTVWVTYEIGDGKKPVILGFQGDSIKPADFCACWGTNGECSSDGSSGGGVDSSVVVSGDTSGALAAMNQLASGGYAYGRGANKYDCSSAVSWAWVQAGIIPGSHENYYTGNMVKEYTKHGFVVVNVSTANSSQLQPGDVLISNSHAAMYMGNGKMTYANSKRGNGIGNYYDFSPHTVLRYKG